MSIFTVYRVASWSSTSAATIAESLNTGATMRPTTLTVFFQAVVGAGGSLADIDALGAKWGGRYIDRAGQALVDGDLAGLSVLLALATGVSETTAGALQSVVAANTLTAGQANWPEFDEEGNPTDAPPAEFTAEWVTATLTAAGYGWNGTQWTKG